MNIHRPALRHAARGVTAWFLVLIGIAETVVQLVTYPQPIGVVTVIAAFGIAAILFRFRYLEVVDGERRAAERKAFDEGVAAQAAATRKLLAEITAGGCPTGCTGCASEAAANEQLMAQWRHERAVRHGHATT